MGRSTRYAPRQARAAPAAAQRRSASRSPSHSPSRSPSNNLPLLTTPAAPGPLVAAQLLELQRHAGNAAAQRLVATVQRAPVAPVAPVAPAGPAAAIKPLADIDTLSLSDFDQYAREQADWSTDPGLDRTARRQLMTLLEWARGHDVVLTGCGDMTVASLRATGVTAQARRRLLTYSEGAEGGADAVRLPVVNDVGKALSWGQALETLYQIPGRETAKRIVKQEAETADVMEGQLELLASKSYVRPFTQYVSLAKPFLESDADMESYLRMREEDSKNPLSFISSLPGVRNIHRFEAELLTAAAANRRDTSRRRPLSLVLHTSHDHNGAFMRDGGLTNVFKRATHLTLLIEGATTLAGIQGQIPVLARRYGRGRKLAEAMVAGHGGSQTLELAGVPGTAAAAGEGLDLVGNRAATEGFFNTLLSNMEDSPDARIVLNACLTASNVVNAPLSGDPAVARRQVQDAISAQPSLATRVQQLAAARGLSTQVRGASGSFGSEATLHDPSTGQLDIVSARDPELTNPDKFAYVEHGADPEGAVRAVLECWAIDKARTLGLVRNRVTALAGATAIKPVVIRQLYAIIKDNEDDAALINRLADAATPLSHLRRLDDSEPGGWSGMDTLATSVPAAHMASILPPVITAARGSNRVAPLVAAGAWAKQQAGKADDFVTELGRHTCRDIERFIPASELAGHLAVPALLGGGGSTAGKVRLSVVTVRRGAAGANESKTHLQGVLGADTSFPAASGVATAIAGYWNEPGLLVAIDRGPAEAPPPPPVGGGAPVGPTPNVDLDGDGVNDFYVVPETRRAAVTARALNVRERPSTAAGIATAVPSGTRMDVIGSVGDWKAVDFRGRVRFVYGSWLRLMGVA